MPDYSYMCLTEDQLNHLAWCHLTKSSSHHCKGDRVTCLYVKKPHGRETEELIQGHKLQTGRA